MPEISRFYGIVVRMFFDDHNPPQFHARLGTFTSRGRIYRNALRTVCTEMYRCSWSSTSGLNP